jgi:phosphatidylglycerophosphate synthase
VGATRQVQGAAAPESPVDDSGLPAIRLAAILGIPVTAVLLGVLSGTSGLGMAGWITGLAAGAAATTSLVTARMRSENPAFLPADWITLTRALLSAGVAGVVADSFVRPASITALVTLSILALVLDGVDGQVARRTGTATPLGARLDGEVDAFLILLLSIAVSQSYGSWVLAIGAARYVLLLAGWAIPWLAAPLPPRYWRKVVAAVQGIVLTVAVSGVLDKLVGMMAVAVALLLLAESFGRDVIWLGRAVASPRTRRAVRLGITVLSVVLVWADLLLPNRAWQLTPAAFVRIPVEALVLVAVALVLSPVPRRIVAGIAGVLFTVLAFAKFLDLAFYEFADRPFNPVNDWGSLRPAVDVIRDAIGSARTDLALVALWIGLIILLVALTAATIHITTVAARHRRGAVRGLAALTAVWGVCAGLSLQFIPGSPIASTSAAALAVAQVRATQAAFTDQRRFAQAINSADPEASVPASDLLSGLRGKDVIIDFVESYGQTAVRDSSVAPGVDTLLRRSTASLARAGWSAQSAWITAPGFGGISQLAHATLQSGLWVNTTQRYAQLITSNRYTLSDAFDEAGWRTVIDSPEDEPGFPAGPKFYHFDKDYGRSNVGYQGPSFSYASMPDQYTYAELQRLELGPGHKPVMAEIDTVSSHSPWIPVPAMVPWSKVGNGSIFDSMPARGATALSIFGNISKERQAFGRSIEYSIHALMSWVTELHDPNLVLIFLGDEQPAGGISPPGASHAVPISVVARDPSVFRQIASWHWQDGLLPGRTAPLEPMSAFRNRFLDAFSTPTAQTASGPLTGNTRTATVSAHDTGLG